MDPLTDLSDHALARAIEDNEIEFLLALGRAGGGEERTDDRITWNIGGSPIGYHNCVVRADLRPQDANEVIIASRELMRDKGVAGSWHVGPSMRPDDLGPRLEAHGFEGGPEPGMAADLEALIEPAAIDGWHVDRVTTKPQLDAYEHVLSLGFGEGPREARWVCAMYDRIGLAGDTDWGHYVGSLAGTPVATASIFLGAGVAGLYFVSTAPAFRRRGLGMAISYTALAGARDLGFRAGVLGSSPMGHAVYRRLGFRDVCDIDVYEWEPDR